MKKLAGWGIAVVVLSFLCTVLLTLIRTAKNVSAFMKPIKS